MELEIWRRRVAPGPPVVVLDDAAADEDDAEEEGWDEDMRLRNDVLRSFGMGVTRGREPGAEPLLASAVELVAVVGDP